MAADNLTTVKPSRSRRNFMYKRSFIIQLLVAVAACLGLLGACGSTTIEPEAPEPSGSDTTTTAPLVATGEANSTGSTQTTSSLSSDSTLATTTTELVSTTTTSAVTTPTTSQPTTTQPTTTAAPVTSTTAPYPTFEIETVEPGQDLISTVSPSA